MWAKRGNTKSEEEEEVTTEEESNSRDENEILPSWAPMNFLLLSHMTLNLYCNLFVSRVNNRLFASED